MSQPEKAFAYDFYLPLADALDPASFLIDPTIVAGDFVVSLDGGASANLTNLPAASPAGSSNVLVQLTAAEMTADKVVVTAVDQAGSEWEDATVFIDNPIANQTRIAGRIGLDPDNPITTRYDNTISFGDVEIEATNSSTITVQTRTS